MRRFFYVVLLLIVILTAGCGAKDTVTINADPKTYTPFMSSVQGITLTPDFITKTKDKILVYHWKTDEGELIGFGKEGENQGEAVVWSAIENDKVAEIKDDFDIKLTVTERDSKKVLATATITITRADNGFYKIKES